MSNLLYPYQRELYNCLVIYLIYLSRTSFNEKFHFRDLGSKCQLTKLKCHIERFSASFDFDKYTVLKVLNVNQPCTDFIRVYFLSGTGNVHKLANISGNVLQKKNIIVTAF